MKTQLLCDIDSYLVDFEATVLSCDLDGGAWRVVLDRTAFYPEGGGQASDLGTLSTRDAVATLREVRKDDEGGVVLHFCDAALSAGAAVKGRLDWVRRYRFMRRHSGQHLVSAAMKSLHGWNTVAVHIGLDLVSIEIDREIDGDSGTAPGILAMTAIEDEVMRVVREALPVRAYRIDDADAGLIPFRRPPAKTEGLRVVQIGGSPYAPGRAPEGSYDCAACGGTHVGNTAEIALVKCVGAERVRGHSRLLWKIADGAYEDYRLKHAVADAFSRRYSVPVEGLAEALKADAEAREAEKKRAAVLERRLAEALAFRFLGEAEREGAFSLVVRVFEGEEEAVLKAVALRLVAAPGLVFCLIHRSPGRSTWIAGCSEGMKLPFDEWKKDLLTLIEGKGGGRAPLWQGAGSKPEGASEFTRVFLELSRKWCRDSAP